MAPASWAACIWSAIRRLGHVQLYAIAEPQIEKARQLASDLGVEKVEADYRRMLDDPAIDAVHVCVPNALHFPIAKAALQAGKHVLCEKPLAISVAEGASNWWRWRAKTGLRNCTFHNLRYYPMVQQMRAHARSRRSGRNPGGAGHLFAGLAALRHGLELAHRAEGERPLARAWPISARTGAIWRSTSPGCASPRLCADLQTFHKTRKRPKGPLETFAGKTLTPAEYD